MSYPCVLQGLHLKSTEIWLLWGTSLWEQRTYNKQQGSRWYPSRVKRLIFYESAKHGVKLEDSFEGSLNKGRIPHLRSSRGRATSSLSWVFEQEILHSHGSRISRVAPSWTLQKIISTKYMWTKSCLIVPVTSLRVGITSPRIGMMQRCQTGVHLHVTHVYWVDVMHHFPSIQLFKHFMWSSFIMYDKFENTIHLEYNGVSTLLAYLSKVSTSSFFHPCSTWKTICKIIFVWNLKLSRHMSYISSHHQKSHYVPVVPLEVRSITVFREISFGRKFS